MLQLIQIGMNTSDIPGSLRLFSDVIGFSNAGSQGLWGNTIAVQGLPADSRAVIWWLIGADPFFQLEIFQHTRPAQRALAADWRPSDNGWVRFGVRVDDFDRALAGLASMEISPICPPQKGTDGHRVAFRDPFVGTIVEVMERLPAKGDSDLGPQIAYVTSSVSNLAAAHTFYGETLGLKIEALDLLHQPEDEKLWGLGGAKRDGFLVRLGGVVLEVVCYREPLGRSRPADYRVSDQGLVNVALGSRDASLVSATFDRVRAAGYVPPSIFAAGGIVWGSLTDAERELEFGSIPIELDAALGYMKAAPFQS
jgi:catechol 2,3-dioxygenase-like lactoylglutathione lyase family enzyme